MKHVRSISVHPALFIRWLVLLSLFGFLEPAPAQIAPHLVISEVYGGGGNSGALYRNDFVELYNPTSVPVTMTNWSVQYQSATNTGSVWQKTVVSGTLPPHRFYLVQEAQGSGGTAALPAPDASGTISLGSTSGKVALASDTLTITGPSAPNVIDFVGYGSANQFEGTAAAGALSNTASAERKARGASTAASMADGGNDSLAGNGWDAGDNRSDFVVVPTQGPQNSASPAEDPSPAGGLPPAISDVRRTRTVAEVGGTDTVFAAISDPDGVVVSARLLVRVNGGLFDSSVVMTPVSGSDFRGVIPASANAAGGALVEYAVFAADDSSNHSSTAASPGGYFTGDVSVAAVKSRALVHVVRYGARFAGALNVRANTFSNGQGFLQDATGGIRLFASGGLPPLGEGRNVRVEGTLADAAGAYELAPPGLSFTDTLLGASSLTPEPIALPLDESETNAREGTLVKIAALSAPGSGTFAAGASYLFQDAGADTLTVRVESYGGANTLAGTPFSSSPVDAIGILSFSNGALRLLPRKASDMGNAPPLTFDASSSGNWSDTNTWSGRRVPSDSNDVTCSTTGVTVTIDLPDARCRNLTMTGSGTTLGPTLQFAAGGIPGLTVNGNLAISGGSGGGQGGRSKLTSNGNPSATLVLRHGLNTTSSNSSGNGNSGLNMNEGFVKLVGSTFDTLRTGAGLRLGNLQVGDGLDAKTVLWSSSKKSTLVIRSLIVKSRSTFWVGDAADTNAIDIGNASAAGVPTLTGGIAVEQDARLLVQASPSDGPHGAVNLDGGGIVNDGTIVFHSGTSRSSYTVNIGGLPAGSASSDQVVGGSRNTEFADVTVAAGHTLTFERSALIADPYRLILEGSIVESPGQAARGRIEATRVVGRSVAERFGGIGCSIDALGASPKTTLVVRVTGVPQGASILRYFDIFPEVNSGLGAALDFTYDESELAGQQAAELRLWRSPDGGVTWTSPSGASTDTIARTVHLGGINSFSRWTASDTAHRLENSSIRLRYALRAGWNLISFPLDAAGAQTASLFGGAESPAFFYRDAYFSADTLHPGVGYWVKVRADEADTVAGLPAPLDSVDVRAGWNLIGSPSFPLSVEEIVQNPPGIVTSRFFRYESGYAVSGQLEPGTGYWVKVSGGGTLYFRPGH